MVLSGSRDPWGIDEVEQVAPPVLDGAYSEDPEEPFGNDAPAGQRDEPAEVSPSDVTPVYLLTLSTSPSESRAELALRHTTAGELALLAYSNLDVLVQCCGEHQPWIAVPAEQVSPIATSVEAETVVLDVVIPQQQWHTGEEP